MMETKHTPGRWYRKDTADYAEIHSDTQSMHQPIALVGNPCDAHLIAAAPDLLEALEMAMSDGVPMRPATIHTARAALAKARGGV